MKNKSNKSKLNLSKSAIAFYIVGAISFIVFVYTIYNVQVYLNSLISQGQITWAANWADMLSYYINNGFNYFLYAAILVGIGYVIALLKKGFALPATETVEVFPNNEYMNTVEEVKTEPIKTVEEVKTEEMKEEAIAE